MIKKARFHNLVGEKNLPNIWRYNIPMGGGQELTFPFICICEKEKKWPTVQWRLWWCSARGSLLFLRLWRRFVRMQVTLQAWGRPPRMGVTGILVGRDILRGSSINDVIIFKRWGEGLKSKGTINDKSNRSIIIWYLQDNYLKTAWRQPWYCQGILRWFLTSSQHSMLRVDATSNSKKLA